MKKLLTAVIGVAALVAGIAAQPAAAATEVGNRCAGNTSEAMVTAISLANAPGSPIPATVPSAGVITSWTFTIALPVPAGSLTETLQVFRPSGSPSQFQIVGESAPGGVAGGTSSFQTRIAVQPGDHIGAVARTPEGSTGAVYCETAAAGDRVGWVAGPPPVGSATIAEEEEGVQNPVVAFVEPDADNDGYGDETQDKCPQNAATQAACPAPPPPVTLSTSSIAKKGLVTVLVTANSQAPVTVAGTVKLGKGKSAKLSGGTQVVVPGAIAKFTLLFPEKLKSKLRQLSRKQFLWLNLAATAPNSAGAITTSNLKVKLKGQAKPRLHAKAKAKPKGQA